MWPWLLSGMCNMTGVTCCIHAKHGLLKSSFLSVACHVPSEIYRFIGNSVGNMWSENTSDISPSHGLSKARPPKLVGKMFSISGALLPMIGRNQLHHISRAGVGNSWDL